MDKKIIHLNNLLEKINLLYASQQDDKIIESAISEFKQTFINIKNDNLIMDEEKRNVFKHTVVYSYSSIREYTFLHLMVIHGTPEDVKWALDHGWNANFYPFNNKDPRKKAVTPVGLAAYTFSHRQLKVLLENGGDPFLKFSTAGKEHLPEWGSTLLYRLMNMPLSKQKRKFDKLKTIEVLIPYYDNLLLTTSSGKTPIDNSIDDIGVQEILEEVAKREKVHLSKLPELNKNFPDLHKDKRI